MSTTASNISSAISSASEAAEASAELGVANARLGYSLTAQALKENTAAVVFPLLLLEIEAFALGVAAYVAETPTWAASEARANSLIALAKAYWGGQP